MVLSCQHNQVAEKSPVPANSSQMILVLTDSVSANQGKLIRFQRASASAPWQQIGMAIPIALGRNGMAWGRGLHTADTTVMPFKREGDGRSPAGVFTLSAAFGQVPKEQLLDIKMPYIYLMDGVECVDDPASRFYNQMVDTNKVDAVDWHSSEKMWHPGIWYRWGAVVDHNKTPVVPGAGSCIFLHNWSEPGETTAGCTAMAPEQMKGIILWLDPDKHPVLVQLPFPLYQRYRQSWQLPAWTPRESN
jgi:L,D-peptidoglycan transpeptidase YkuD (ErfK/YbiS/YcfS/YnhG family)